MDLDDEADGKRKRRTGSPAGTLPTSHEAHRPKKKAESKGHPRWHNQAYMLFLALRESPERCLPRSELIRAALAMDERISKERGLPTVFKGKTPQNSASASLTTNTDRYFIPFKPEGSRSLHFKLAYDPGNFDGAVQEYRKWERKLAEHDWPFCFGVPKEKPVGDADQDGAATANDASATPPATTPSDPAAAAAAAAAEAATTHDALASTHGTSDARASPTAAAAASAAPFLPSSSDPAAAATAAAATAPDDPLTPITPSDTAPTPSHAPDTTEPMDTEAADDKVSHDPVPNAAAATAPGSSSGEGRVRRRAAEVAAAQLQPAPPPPDVPEVRLEDLDLTNVPTSWKDIVRVAESTIPNAGQGLFATRKLPYNSPVGFYFGVPMTEDEYDSLKDQVGRASEYSIMYRRTVLDATDDKGQPFTDPDGPMYCPFHFMNESSEEKANILFIEGAVVNQVICWTKRDILPGEELFVWYGSDVRRHWPKHTATATATTSSSSTAAADDSPSSRPATTTTTATTPAPEHPPSTAAAPPSPAPSLQEQPSPMKDGYN